MLNLLMVPLIMGCALIGTIISIGVCAPLSAVNSPTNPPRDNTPSTVIEKPFWDDWHFNDNRSGSTSSESTGEDAIRDNFREWIASSSIPTLRSRGMTDEEFLRQKAKEGIIGLLFQSIVLIMNSSCHKFIVRS